jgi:hypothetical protein
MLSFYEYKSNKEREYLKEDDSESIFTAPDKTKVLPVINQAISKIEPMISGLNDIAKKMEEVGVNSTKVKSSAESLNKYVEKLKESLTKSPSL